MYLDPLYCSARCSFERIHLVSWIVLYVELKNMTSWEHQMENICSITSFKSKYPQNSAWHNNNFFFWNFFSKPSLITNFRVIENSIILKYMLDKRIQQLKSIGVYTPKPKANNVLIVIQKWERLKKGKELPWFYFQPSLFQFSDLPFQFFIPAK